MNDSSPLSQSSDPSPGDAPPSVEASTQPGRAHDDSSPRDAPAPATRATNRPEIGEPSSLAHAPPATDPWVDGDPNDHLDREPPFGEEPFGRLHPSHRRAHGGPRDRLWSRGVAELADAELVAVLLGSGMRGRSVIELATELVERWGGLRGLSGAHPAEVARLAGIGEVKAARLIAAVEMGRRIVGRPWRRGDAFLGAKQVFERFAPRLRDERREFFIAASLDIRHRLIADEVVSCGSLVASIVHPREVYRSAIRHAAAAIVVAHNHPSGDPTPSAEDWAVTDRLRRSGETLGIDLLDHVIIGDGAWVSLRERCRPRRE